MVRVVIDTNCLRASVPPKSPYYQLYLDFVTGRFEWYVSSEILLEYEEILSRTYSPNTANEVLHRLTISPNTVFAEPYFKWNLIENDPDDNKFVDLAICTNCNFLVTNDKAFSVLRNHPFPKLRVIDLESFLQYLLTL
ncbi:putative toxin-antitoxin system toxin component, PIN family [Dyadobacter aurulentus]|uniref:putative toxin-antitoxin system toxin component, PIN family n=1 Tax=Dyadobacter sp. UC 10 TaxID=2605428 RepID=UPI0011F2A1FD|nr:putative toxin-antitoxin system toxin component, PIN family [Dyadobacter sp. UC 10]KAA0989543.1 putative toxin-antitoxin system toxin component, PIN family [Dyadobacter sp. UC 10]